jgi:hypothetical protein
MPDVVKINEPKEENYNVTPDAIPAQTSSRE